LKNAGSISAEIAKKLATEQYEKFRVIQDDDFESDFDKEIKRIKGKQWEIYHKPALRCQAHVAFAQGLPSIPKCQLLMWYLKIFQFKKQRSSQ